MKLVIMLMFIIAAGVVGYHFPDWFGPGPGFLLSVPFGLMMGVGGFKVADILCGEDY